MRRIALAVMLALSFLAALPGEVQPQAKAPRIAVLGAASTSPAHALREGLRDLGYVEGRTIAIDWRWARGDERGDAADLVRLKVDAIIAVTNPAIEAAQRETRTIPIIMVLAPDPVGDKFVASLARPGGNITGLTTLGPELAYKHLQLFKEAIPTLSRLALLWDPAGRQQSVNETETAARGWGSTFRFSGRAVPVSWYKSSRRSPVPVLTRSWSTEAQTSSAIEHGSPNTR